MKLRQAKKIIKRLDKHCTTRDNVGRIVRAAARYYRAGCLNRAQLLKVQYYVNVIRYFSDIKNLDADISVQLTPKGCSFDGVDAIKL